MEDHTDSNKVQSAWLSVYWLCMATTRDLQGDHMWLGWQNSPLGLTNWDQSGTDSWILQTLLPFKFWHTWLFSQQPPTVMATYMIIIFFMLSSLPFLLLYMLCAVRVWLGKCNKSTKLSERHDHNFPNILSCLGMETLQSSSYWFTRR